MRICDWRRSVLAERLPYDDPLSESRLYIYAMICWSAIIDNGSLDFLNMFSKISGPHIPENLMANGMNEYMTLIS